MGFSARTTHLKLPQWLGTDKPSWEGDVNGAFAAIDRGYRNLMVKVDAVKLIADQVRERNIPTLSFQSHDVPPGSGSTVDAIETPTGYVVDFGLVRGITSWDELPDKPQLSDVATSGDYNDLINKPDPAITVVNNNDGTITLM